jgi:hypothetical protein
VGNISATDAEKAAAWATVNQVRDYLAGEDWPDPVLADSGNGYNLLYHIDLPADDDGLVKCCLEALARLFDSDRVKIDLKVFNPARITKPYGTVARKGDLTPERPHRRSGVLHTPESEMQPVPPEKLHALAAEVPQPEQPTSAGARNSTGDGHFEHRLDVARYLTPETPALRDPLTRSECVTTPTSRSLELLRSLGFVAGVVERWLPRVNLRRELFHCIDLIAVHARDRIVLGVQTASIANISPPEQGQAAAGTACVAGGRRQV